MTKSKQLETKKKEDIKKARDSKDYEVMLIEMLEEEFNKKEND